MATISPIFRGGSGGDSGARVPFGRILLWVGVAILAVIVVSFTGCGIKIVDTFDIQEDSVK